MKAFVVLTLTPAWIASALFLTYVSSWSLHTIIPDSSYVNEVTAGANLLLAIGTFVAFFILAKLLVQYPKETNDLH